MFSAGPTRKARKNAIKKALEALKAIGRRRADCKNACFLRVEQENHVKMQSGGLSAKNAFFAISQ